MAAGACMAGRHVWQEGMHGNGGVWQGGMCGREACMAWGHGMEGMHGVHGGGIRGRRRTVTSACSKHPTECILVT